MSFMSLSSIASHAAKAAGLGCALLALVAASPAGAARVEATKDPANGDVVLANDRLRVVFHHGAPKFGWFPDGWTGFSVLTRSEDSWTTMAKSPSFSAIMLRTPNWGRDFLHYALPQQVEIEQTDDSASVLFTAVQMDLDRGFWKFQFRYTLGADDAFVDTVYQVTPSDDRELLLFWGPRLYAGEGTFGAAKDEALFAGLEYLGPNDRSSGMLALATDVQRNYVPDPSKVTMPLMSVMHGGNMVGLTWDPAQKWLGSHATPPSPMFASPNWLESKENHLLGLFLPSVPDFVAENSFKAHKPVAVKSSETLTLTAQIFAAPGKHATDAVEFYLAERGGFPKPQATPKDAQAFTEWLVRCLVEQWDAENKRWTWIANEGEEPLSKPNAQIAWRLLQALPVLKDRALAAKAEALAHEALELDDSRPFGLALLSGRLEESLADQVRMARERREKQQPDGAWVYNPTEDSEKGLMWLSAPPEPGVIAPPETRAQGITAMEAFSLLDYALIADDAEAYAAGLRGLQDIERYTIPTPFANDECPPSPSLHGAYLALRAYIAAYQISQDPAHLERARYWALTGVPFIYLWGLPAREVPGAQVNGIGSTVYKPEEVYENPTRDAMLYGSLYGYGSSQFMFPWYAVLVQWIGMHYAEDLTLLAPYDKQTDWRPLIDGLLASSQWQNFDTGEVKGFFPDAFNVRTWTPSGPAFSPAHLLNTMLVCEFDRPAYRTAVVRNGEQRWHLTSPARVEKAEGSAVQLRFELSDVSDHTVRTVITGVPAGAELRVDGNVLAAAADLETAPESWKRTEQGLLMLKLPVGTTPRVVEITFNP